MIVEVTEVDYAKVRESIPEEAPRWMRQEFVANFALQRYFPQAQVIKVDHTGIRIDEDVYRRPFSIFVRDSPFRFRLSSNKWLVFFFDVRHNLLVRR